LCAQALFVIVRAREKRPHAKGVFAMIRRSAMLYLDPVSPPHSARDGYGEVRPRAVPIDTISQCLNIDQPGQVEVEAGVIVPKPSLKASRQRMMPNHRYRSVLDV
jgi:hypothetical protein